MRCLNCGKEPSRSFYKYCSNKCQQEYVWSLLVVEIESLQRIPDGRSDRVIKRYLLEKTGHQCSICKNTDWMGDPIPLELDHIDGNSSNSNLNNFRLVCGNCGMKLPTYKSKNKGNGREYRRKQPLKNKE